MQLSKFNLVNKNALITGAAGLLGFEHSMALLESNANLILTDISLDQLRFKKDKIKKEYPSSKVHIFQMDVSSLESIKMVNDELISNDLNVDILINNAAIDAKVEGNKNLKRLEDFSLEQWDKEIGVGLTGSFLCSKVFGSQMVKDNKKGVILNIASDLSVIAPNQGLYRNLNLPEFEQDVKPITYSVIKTGLIGLTRYLSTYWCKEGIRCNALSPGGVFNNQPEEFVEKISKLIPLGRMAKSDEYRSAIQFLCSDASEYLNGQNIVIDGGRSVW